MSAFTWQDWAVIGLAVVVGVGVVVGVWTCAYRREMAKPEPIRTGGFYFPSTATLDVEALRPPRAQRELEAGIRLDRMARKLAASDHVTWRTATAQDRLVYFIQAAHIISVADGRAE